MMPTLHASAGGEDDTVLLNNGTPTSPGNRVDRVWIYAEVQRGPRRNEAERKAERFDQGAPRCTSKSKVITGAFFWPVTTRSAG